MPPKLQLLVVLTVGLITTAYSQFSTCIPGLAVFNQTNHLVLPLGVCNQDVDAKVLAQPPMVTFTRAKSNETYLLMLLESTRVPDIYILRWLVSEVKALGSSLQTALQTGARDLSGGYTAPVNQTQYEFRLYNTTGNVVWEAVSNGEKNNFFPSQWLAKNRVHSAPIAKSIFSVKSIIPGPPGWVVPQNPVTQAQQPYPVPGQNPPYPSHQGGYPVPPVVPGHPITYPSNLAPPPVGQVPHYPPGQAPSQVPHYPQSQVPSQLTPNQHPPYVVPNPVLPQLPPNQLPPQLLPNQHPSNQHPPSNFPNQVPQQFLPQYPIQPSGIHVKDSYNINGTWYHLQTPDKHSRNNILIINSTLYSSETFNKKFHLTPYLMVDYKTYVWRNLTRTPGNGQSLFINGTMYVPYTPSSNEIHHHHYHKKGAASSLYPSSLFFVLLIPSLISIFRS